MEIRFTTRIFKEGRTYVAHARELDVSSCGGSKERALKNLKDAVRLFLEEPEKMGTLEQIIEEAGFIKHNQKIAGPQVHRCAACDSPNSADTCQKLRDLSQTKCANWIGVGQAIVFCRLPLHGKSGRPLKNDGLPHEWHYPARAIGPPT